LIEFCESFVVVIPLLIYFAESNVINYIRTFLKCDFVVHLSVFTSKNKALKKYVIANTFCGEKI